MDKEQLKGFNLPESYIKFLSENETNNICYFFNTENVKDIDGGEEYTFWGQKALFAKSYSPNFHNFEYLSNEEIYYKSIEFSGEGLSKSEIQKSFVIGKDEGGGFIFINHIDGDLWLLYDDLFIKKLASSFDFFLDNSEFSEKVAIQN
ncbi:SMI1/KNR4 family protein [Zophobihabitans entericus]|uniref:Knr4/Smi1-like domain-containing protein n=1 Tax=Zophobihabitans entericus TaxID=1635327 RepID=A0A6G9IB27_9GAMM|nr:SMI1/KNR4 family protein [Zophobihabitans entericus]QIQ21438.1 hypothetical protein IPMB12_06915 [Zophobihabitans entericus]